MMQELQLKVQKLHPNARLPHRASEGAAGADLCAVCGPEGITLAPLQRALIPTGLAIELPGRAYVALLYARSGLSLREGLAMANGVGVIDSDYRGEVQVPAVNLSDRPIHIQDGERIAQLVVSPVALPDIVEADELTSTARGEGGFGSTGK